MTSTQRLRTRRPLAGITPRGRHAMHRSSGMHSPNDCIRTDNDAFEVRGDVSVEDACTTSLHLVRMAVSQLELLGCSPDLDPPHREVIEGIACLGRLACGTLGLIDSALHEKL